MSSWIKHDFLSITSCTLLYHSSLFNGPVASEGQWLNLNWPRGSILGIKMDLKDGGSYFKVVPEGCFRYFFEVKFKTVKLIGGRILLAARSVSYCKNILQIHHSRRRKWGAMGAIAPPIIWLGGETMFWPPPQYLRPILLKKSQNTTITGIFP